MKALIMLLGVGAGIVVGLVNFILMIISPRTWFRMPRWIRLNGSMVEAKYSTGWGAIQVRLLGAIFLAVTIWMLCAFWHHVVAR